MEFQVGAIYNAHNLISRDQKNTECLLFINTCYMNKKYQETKVDMTNVITVK